MPPLANIGKVPPLANIAKFGDEIDAIRRTLKLAFNREPAGHNAMNAKGGTHQRKLTEDRFPLDLSQIVRAICAVTAVQLVDLCSRKRQSEIAGVRWDLAAIAVGRYGHRICDLAAILNKNAGSVSRWLTEADRRQTSDPEYRTHLDHLEHKMVEVAVQNITM